MYLQCFMKIQCGWFWWEDSRTDFVNTAVSYLWTLEGGDTLSYAFILFLRWIKSFLSHSPGWVTVNQKDLKLPIPVPRNFRCTHKGESLLIEMHRVCNLLHLYDVSVFVRLFWTRMGKTHPFLCLSRIHVVHLSEQLLAALRLKHLTLVLQRSWGFSQHLFLLPNHWSGECFTLSQSSSGACSCRVKLGKRDCHLWMLTSQRARGKQPQSVNVWVMLLIYLWVSSSLRLAAFWNVFAWNWRCSSAV